ncbi:tyrosine protein phosphatase [Ornithinibacillus sp. L9]|uniref:Tyrosine-protein phosphatase n=1 Tax=Ornithinibacillus caprae TaxID=2678566 RepID=A0A6N8FDE1_9BACI|nr:CpsB/CapC family capsule biosynthesis tyrosine phosphatase [Ornithinibacillus caprae]MUK87405.1 tyrosine protein phosphatase [Ornithinibacillus caprae]
MIDIHCHILPGVDDGARTITESIAMAREANIQGIQKIIATPHHQNGAFTNSALDVMEAVNLLNEQLQSTNIPVEILPGQETRIYGDMVKGLKTGDVLPLNETSRYVFVELPESHVPQYTSQLLFDIQIVGYIPIISNVERNQELFENPDKLYRLVKNGAVTEMNAASVVGKAGKKVQKFTQQLLQANLAHFIGSNAHNLKKRGFYLRDAFEEIGRTFGSTYSYQLMENSEAVVSGLALHKEEPERIASQKIWKIFSR